MKAIVSFLHTSEIARLIFSLVAYGSLFAVSIRQNRRNRAVVLGIVTVGICVAFLLLATSKYVPPWLVGTTAAFGGIGFYDDYLKLVIGNSKGLPARYKYVAQSVAALCAAFPPYPDLLG